MKILRLIILSTVILLIDTKTTKSQERRGITMLKREGITKPQFLRKSTKTKPWTENVSPLYNWTAWSTCRGGHKTRRKHCVQPPLCGNTVTLQVTRCNHIPKKYNHKMEKKMSSESHFHHNESSPMKKQMAEGGVPHKARSRGFSAWSGWTPCSRKCTTTRRRFCRRPLLCGKEVVSQSAYCYHEGSYCHQWIRTRMQRRQDPGNQRAPISKSITENENSLQRIEEPKCGKLGRIKGSAGARMRARMQMMRRIIGGRPAPPGKWPWQVVILNRYKEAFCGGTLVSLRWVVTAAHCVRRRMFVRVGEHDLLLYDRGEVEMRVVETVVHPRYDAGTVINDVALLRLSSPARPEYGHGVVCLPQPKYTLPSHSSCVILGWGKKKASDVHGSRILHEAQVSTIEQDVCRKSYWQYTITNNMMCAGKGRRDSCAGDSGGPLLCKHNSKFYLQGITSFGDGCGKRGKFGIYTRTANYVPWIQSIISQQYYDD